MRTIIKPEDFPIEMNEENIEILARMKLNYPPPIKFPPSTEWRAVLPLLSESDKILISNKINQIQKEIDKQRWESLTHEEQEEEKHSIEKSLKEGPEVYRGNILQQEWDSIDIEKKEKEKKEKEGKDEKEE
ncbi:hypothetical protein [Flavobacterium johnsoniae]|jgi:hypothetical protein|uniref:Uncharacterized protein n=1 Tax=Flavobacterium johnsoniae TaxID=986 RepID=A0A1J7CKG0_FLAJO|nr:hypothetical protein [Flavobacterium johnsoniae]OIV42056.1 hypothetical protein BKM63_10410 [Flavobacterium johnsoniae]